MVSTKKMRIETGGRGSELRTRKKRSWPIANLPKDQRGRLRTKGTENTSLRGRRQVNRKRKHTHTHTHTLNTRKCHTRTTYKGSAGGAEPLKSADPVSRGGACETTARNLQNSKAPRPPPLPPTLVKEAVRIPQIRKVLQKSQSSDDFSAI